MNPLHRIRAALALLAMFVNTLIMVPLLYAPAILKLILPFESIRVGLSKVLVIISETWIANNNAIIALFGSIRWQVEGLEGLTKQQWYFVISNHQSWSDILVLQRIFNRRIPFLKFFLKQELIKVPLLGLAWWALDFPFMKRFSREEIEKNPELKGKDVETTRLACQKFERFPTSVMNFLEGTRFTPSKHERQQSPYTHLLKPKSGGAAFALNAMAGKLKTLVDVTIIYPEEAPKTLLAFLGGTTKHIKVIVRHQEIPAWVSAGDYENDADFKQRFQKWISDIWAEKDACLSAQRR